MNYLNNLNVFKRRRNTSSTDSSSAVSSPASPAKVDAAGTSAGAAGNEAGTPRRKKTKKKKGRKRTISVVPISEVTEASLELWRTLPPKIRHDPSMVSFQQVELEHARLHGKYKYTLGGLHFTHTKAVRGNGWSMELLSKLLGTITDKFSVVYCVV